MHIIQVYNVVHRDINTHKNLCVYTMYHISWRNMEWTVLKMPKI